MSVHKITIVCLSLMLLVAMPVFASETNGTTDSTYKYAWGENLGWVNMKPDTGGLTITDTAITGYAWSSVGGWLNFSPTNSGQGVIVNPTTGALSGSAWSSQYGWISMSGVTINSSGTFTGIAGTASTTAGRITFECDNCDVRTDWRPIPARTVDEETSSRSTSSSGSSANSNSSESADGESAIQSGLDDLDINVLPTDSVQLADTVGTIDENSIPEQLFDINLEIDSEIITDIKNLSARVVFVSFGRVPTAVAMTFDILDKSGKIVHTENDTITVETENVFTKRFFDIDLPDGRYTLKLTTLYNTSVRDEFTAPFEISQDGTGSCMSWWWVVAGIAGLLSFVIFVKRRKPKVKN
jgi:hypothetical protein